MRGPSSVDSTIRPEAHGVSEVRSHVFVLPVEIWLLSRETVEEPLTVTGRCPGRATEHRLPVVWWLLTTRAEAVAKQIAITLRGATASGQSLSEPRMPIGGVIRHNVDDHFDVGGVQSGDHCVEIAQSAEPRINIAVIINVVAAVGEGGWIEGAEPDSIDPERAQVGNP